MSNSNSAMQCPIPDNESRRLEAVQSCEVLDTAPEPEFDAIARLAATLLNAPIAIVGMMDADRLWFKSRIGLEITQIDRSLAICAHTVMQGEPLIIEDLRKDQRFEGHPMVTEAPSMRFYAGAPVVDAAGNALGTIAVMDTQPKTLTDAQRRAMKDLPTLVMTAIDARRLAIQLSRLAMIEPSTGVFNRVQFDMALDAELRHSMRTGEPFTVLRMSLDGLKDIVDGFGRAAGEEALSEVSRRLSQQVRIGDVLARLGDKEFGVVMRHGGESSAEMLEGRIQRAAGQPVTLASGDTVGVGISIGKAAYTDDTSSAGTLLAQADLTLEEAKRQNVKRWSILGTRLSAS